MNRYNLKEKKIVKILEIYRALESDEDMITCSTYKSDILSECYSRVLRTSYLYGSPSLRCFTESIKTAYEYSIKPGYSGTIAAVKVCIWNDGSCSLLDDDNTKNFVHRLWKIEDWIDVCRIANIDVAKNLNYQTKGIKLSSIISYGGQTTARAYAFQSKLWVVHTSVPIAYTRTLLKEEIEEKINKRNWYPSLNCIKYVFNPRVCEDLLDFFDKSDESKAWVRCLKKELNNIKEKFCA